MFLKRDGVRRWGEGEVNRDDAPPPATPSRHCERSKAIQTPGGACEAGAGPPLPPAGEGQG
ncbi:hypothetical protein GCM10007036_03810 [Alsobacter metallidurans]|uniref:Uncharacterized protein n=1 Tax=Alsobacter metallidurans TaxID=340221 RepID=A0A917MG72_9HYPH|nr:hypothetical protein GCM10007036_03810 [Alsobacter metallidurans]